MLYLTDLYTTNKLLFAAIVGFVFLVVVAVLVVLYRAFVGSGVRVPGRGRARQQRLGVVDAQDIDRKRQLVLVRRDNIEHLIMIGGPNDVLIESQIVRVEARPPRERETNALPNNGVQQPVLVGAPPARPTPPPAIASAPGSGETGPSLRSAKIGPDRNAIAQALSEALAMPVANVPAVSAAGAARAPSSAPPPAAPAPAIPIAAPPAPLKPVTTPFSPAVAAPVVRQEAPRIPPQPAVPVRPAVTPGANRAEARPAPAPNAAVPPAVAPRPPVNSAIASARPDLTPAAAPPRATVQSSSNGAILQPKVTRVAEVMAPAAKSLELTAVSNGSVHLAGPVTPAVKPELPVANEAAAQKENLMLESLEEEMAKLLGRPSAPQ